MTNEIPQMAMPDKLHIYSVNWAQSGSLGEYLRENQDLVRRLSNPATSAETGMAIFNNIHARLSRDASHASNELFGLYESADLQVLTNAVNEGMRDKSEEDLKRFIKPEEYRELSYALRLAHDVLYWGGRGDMENYGKSVILLQDEIKKSKFLQLKQVKSTEKAYEITLQQYLRKRHSEDDSKAYTDLSKITPWDSESKEFFLSRSDDKNTNFQNMNPESYLLMGKAWGLA